MMQPPANQSIVYLSGLALDSCSHARQGRDQSQVKISRTIGAAPFSGGTMPVDEVHRRKRQPPRTTLASAVAAMETITTLQIRDGIKLSHTRQNSPFHSRLVRRSMKPEKDTTMTIFSQPTTLRAPLTRSLASAALIGASMLAYPLATAQARSAEFQVTQAATPQTHGAETATGTKGETVEQRIATLHAALKITPDEDAKWNAVAQVMRDNASNVDQLIAENRKTAPQDMNAEDDLKLYQRFAQAHLDGLKNLISSFTTLYSAMPDAQKKVADKVFEAAHQTTGADRG
jgi:protein CpxP